MRTFTDYDIQALIDNELNYEDSKVVRNYIQKNKDALKRHDTLAQQKRMLQSWWKYKKST
ncbi:MAG: hypothetical protein GW778_07420 [Alphaproteobacteria bacterium]|nr:hypothetical protein [Alphaproteobacteria bacterium]